MLAAIQATPCVSVNLIKLCTPIDNPNSMSDTARLANKQRVILCKDLYFLSATKTTEFPLIINTHAHSLITLIIMALSSMITAVQRPVMLGDVISFIPL